MRRQVELRGIDPATALPRACGRHDPTASSAPRSRARAVRTPDGPGTIAFRWDDRRADVEAWGPGAAWLLDAAPRWLGVIDDIAGFGPDHPVVAEVWRRARGARIGATGLVWDELLPTVVSQRVQFPDAARSWRRLVRRYGEPAPGPGGLLLTPSPERLAEVGYHDLHELDLERKRADALLTAARSAPALEAAAQMPAEAAVTRLSGFPGLGPWTATSVASVALGDPDLVVVGDFWMPTIVRHALTGDRRYCDDDAVMLDLLQPFAGHRARVVRLLTAARVRRPRRAPRRELHRIAGF